MRILLSNDDGIQSPGIEALVKALSGEHEVVVVAPAAQQSAMSQAITVRERLYVEHYKPLEEKYGIKAFAITGTPADTVKLYLEAIVEGPEAMPDVVISGINDGANIGTDIIYSGTVGAATEGFVHRISAIAISLNYFPELSFDFVAGELAKHLDELMALSDKPQLLNINFPQKLGEDQHWYWCTQGTRDYNNVYEPYKDEAGKLYYTVGGTPFDDGNEAFTDIAAVNGGLITITPLKLDRTCGHFLKEHKGKILF